MIRVRFLGSYDRSLKALSASDRERVQSAVDKLLDYFSGKGKPLGLGLRRLRKDFWEIRAGLDKRVLFTLSGDLATFIIVGNHDEIRRQLRLI